MRMMPAIAAVAGVAAVIAWAQAAWAAESPVRRLTPVPFTDVRIADTFWAPRLETNRAKTIPYCFRQCEQTGRIDNFAKAAGQMEGKFEGIYFNDSDVYKVLEAAAYALACRPDPELEKYVDRLIATMAAAQQKDGYLYTFYTVNKEMNKRWTNERTMHETYCGGHFIEAAVAHFRATGKRTALDVAIKLADHIDSVFGPGRLRDVPGHEEIELALVKLYDVTGQARYLKLAQFLIDERGSAAGHKLYGDYSQDHKPVREQTEPVGHSVRAMYLYCGMADVAALTGDAGYLRALDAIWQNMMTRKIYLTGGVGARHGGEAFGAEYELPNESAYCETCAAIGNAFWNHRMNLLHADGKYADVLEQVLYNGALAGVSLDGEKFFYVNPLASHGSHHRQGWFGCACCPPNVARFIAQVPGYVYAQDADGIYVNLYVAGTAKVKTKAGEVTLTQETRYPWDGKVKIAVDPAQPMRFTLAVRTPGWVEPPSDGDALYRSPAIKDAGRLNMQIHGGGKTDCVGGGGYQRITRQWAKGDTVEFELPMPVRRMYAHASVKADAGRVALQRGPVVYCFEAADNGRNIGSMYLPPDAALSAEHRPELLGGVTVIRGRASVRAADGPPQTADVTAIPYYAWDQREAGPMAVWIAEKAEIARPVPQPTIASTSKTSASHCQGADALPAMNDQMDPANSGDHAIPRMTWWDHRGTKEWVQYDFAAPAKVGGVEVYWFDDTGVGQCRVPQSWRLLAKTGGKWEPVAGASEYGVAKDRFNRATFTPVTAEGLRIEVELQPKVSGGILEWRVIPAP